MNQSISEKDDFLLNRLLDGDLPEDQADHLRERILREPALRRAFQAYTRLNSSLADRQQDQPDIDWASFRNSIMQSIEALPASYKILRISKWLLVGTPLAAAAALVLLFTFYQSPTTVSSQGQASPDARVVVGVPADAAANKIVIRYNRPALSKKIATGNIEVSYSQSTETADAAGEVDETGHSGWGFGAVKAGTPVLAGESMEIPPM